jgi:predicted GNAT family acetyltransferase
MLSDPLSKSVYSGNLSIRKAAPNDSAKLADLARRSFLGYPFEGVYDPEKVKSGLENGEYRIVAELPGYGIAGTAVLGIENNSPMCEVKRELVDPAFRKNGMAKKITGHLVNDAYKMGYSPWTDARADQIGMQRAAITAGLIPVCLEPGKHVVYSHSSDGIESGPARETMVHLTSLPLDLISLCSSLETWPKNQRKRLIEGLYESFTPPKKCKEVSYGKLPSPKEKAGEIEALLGTELNDGAGYLSEDVAEVRYGGSSMVVIKPDASAFLNNPPTREILGLCNSIGLQAATYYADVSDADLAEQLFGYGLEPVMVRPWKDNANDCPKWQAGWRKNMNGYEKCLHSVNIDPEVKSRIMRLADYLKENLAD